MYSVKTCVYAHVVAMWHHMDTQDNLGPTEVVLARLAFMGKKAVDCGAGGNCLPQTLEVATGEERVRQRLIVRLLRKEYPS